MDYSATVWDPYLQKDINRIEGVQRRAARFIFNDYMRSSSVTAMMESLKWTPLVERRREQRLILLLKIVNDLVVIPTDVVITFNNRPSRNSNNRQIKDLQTLIYIKTLIFLKQSKIGTTYLTVLYIGIAKL